jgi:chromosome segregation ATPase
MGSGRKSRSSVLGSVLKYGATTLAGGILGHACNAPRINELERRNNDLERRNNGLERCLAMARATIAARDRSLEKARAKEAQKDEEIATLRGMVSAGTREIEILKTKEAQKDEALATLRGAASARTREIELFKAQEGEQPTAV